MILNFSIGVLILMLGASLLGGRSFGIESNHEYTNRKRIYEFLKRRFPPKYIFGFSIIAVFALLGYQAFEQYRFWSENGLSKFLLPPYNKNFFLFYVFARFFAPYVASLVISLLFLKITRFFNQKRNDRFFYPEEPYWGAASLFLAGHPGWLVYLISLISIYLFISIAYLMTPRRGERLSMYYLWIPTAIFVILINNYWLQNSTIWQALKI